MNAASTVGRVRLATLVGAVLALGAADAAAQTPGWVYAPVAAPGAPAPAAFGGGLYASFAPPALAPDGRVVFRGEVANAAAASCTGTCRALLRATPDVDCTLFLRPSRIFPDVAPVVIEGQPAPVGAFTALDDAPGASVPVADPEDPDDVVGMPGPLFHTSCYGEAADPFEAVFEDLTPVDATSAPGLPCGSLYSAPGAGLRGVAYWRAVFEAIAFAAVGTQAPTDLVVPLTPTSSRLAGHFLNLAKARSDGWETLERRVAVSESDRVAFLADVGGIDADPVCLGTELACDAAFFLDVPSGVVVPAAARNDALAGGGTIARFCGPPAVAEGGLVVFRALTSAAGDCDPVTGSGQGIYAIASPFVPGTAVTVADAAVALPDGQGGSFTAQTFSDPVVSTTGEVVFRAGPPGAGGGMAAVIRSVPPFGPAELAAVAVKGISNPGVGAFSSFDPAAPAVNARGEIAFLAAEGVWVASPAPLVLQECTEAIALCRRTIFGAVATMVGAEGRAGQMCFRKIIKGKIADVDCWTQDLQVATKLARIRTTLARQLRIACSDDVIPLAGACDRAQPTVAGEIDCLVNTHEPLIRAIFRALVPE